MSDDRLIRHQQAVAYVEGAGAQCDLCPLKGQRDKGYGPVLGEFHREAQFTVIAESPSSADCGQGRALTDEGGMVLLKAMKKAGWRRMDANYIPAVACRPDKGDFKVMDAVRKRRNRVRRRDGKPEYLHPVAACRGALAAQLSASPKKYLTLGKFGYAGLAGKEKPITDIRGGPAFTTTMSPMGADLPILPTRDPKFVSRSPLWSEPFEVDVAKARRHFEGRLTWVEPTMIVKPTPTKLAEFLGVVKDPLGEWVSIPNPNPQVFDYEAEPAEGMRRPRTFDPDLDIVRCLGVGNASMGYVIPYKTCERPDGRTDYSLNLRSEGAAFDRFYHPDEEREIDAILRAWAIGPGLKLGWNAGFYDWLLAKNHLGVEMQGILDGILLHRAIAGEHGHSLGFVASMYTDAPSWKEDHTAVAGEDDYEYFLYNVRDIATTALVMARLIKLCREEGIPVLAKDVERGLAEDRLVQRLR